MNDNFVLNRELGTMSYKNGCHIPSHIVKGQSLSQK